jgi:heme exporter protein B
MKNWFKTVRTLVWKDLVQEWRSRDMLTAMLAFAVLALFIFNYAMELTPANRAEVASGTLWVVILFAGTLGLNRSFTAEQDQGCFDGLVMAVPDLSAIYVAKAITNFLMMVFLTVLVIPLYSVLYNQSMFILSFFTVLLLGSWGYTAAGTLISGMTVQTRMRDLLLPILLFPLLMPVNMAVVKAAGGILAGLPASEITVWIRLLVVYDVIVSVVGVMVFEYVIQE